MHILILSVDNRGLYIYILLLSTDKYRHNASLSPSSIVSKFAGRTAIPLPTVGAMFPIEIRLQTADHPLSHPQKTRSAAVERISDTPECFLISKPRFTFVYG